MRCCRFRTLSAPPGPSLLPARFMACKQAGWPALQNCEPCTLRPHSDPNCGGDKFPDMDLNCEMGGITLTPGVVYTCVRVCVQIFHFNICQNIDYHFHIID